MFENVPALGYGLIAVVVVAAAAVVVGSRRREEPWGVCGGDGEASLWLGPVLRCLNWIMMFPFYVPNSGDFQIWLFRGELTGSGSCLCFDRALALAVEFRVT